MPYVPMTLKAWIAANPDYNKYAGTVSGTPLIYSIGTAGSPAPTLTSEAWFVFDWVTGLPDTTQAPANADITSTGKTSRNLLDIVPDAPSASELTINLGKDTDKAIEDIQGFVGEYQDAVEAGKTFYVGVFLGAGKLSQAFAAAVSWSGAVLGDFPDPYTTTLSVTPDVGTFNKFVKITDIGG